MSCDRIQDLLAPYADSDLAADDKVLVESHCRTCADCAGLLAALKEADEALAGFPEIEPSPALLDRLYRLPVERKVSRPRFRFFLRPSLQPVFAAAAVFMTLVSLYFINPNRKELNRAVVRQFHRGVSQVERLYAKAEALTDTLGAYADNLFVALKAINPLSQNEE
jgi:anti-sigma factor RsiW